jgi:predicted enzyme related to lactoylglutathione lyase
MKHLINWVEIPVTDMDRACRFYGTIMGVELPRMEKGGSLYALFPTEDHFNAGALVKGPDRAPGTNGTLIYLDGSPDLADILKKVARAGGRVLMEKTWLSKEAGYTGRFRDSEGNSVGLQHM